MGLVFLFGRWAAASLYFIIAWQDFYLIESQMRMAFFWMREKTTQRWTRSPSRMIRMRMIMMRQRIWRNEKDDPKTKQMRETMSVAVERATCLTQLYTLMQRPNTMEYFQREPTIYKNELRILRAATLGKLITKIVIF